MSSPFPTPRPNLPTRNKLTYGYDVKHLECPFHFGEYGCTKASFECKYAHHRTGKMAEMPKYIRGYGCVAGANLPLAVRATRQSNTPATILTSTPTSAAASPAQLSGAAPPFFAPPKKSGPKWEAPKKSGSKGEPFAAKQAGMARSNWRDRVASAAEPAAVLTTPAGPSAIAYAEREKQTCIMWDSGNTNPPNKLEVSPTTSSSSFPFLRTNSSTSSPPPLWAAPPSPASSRPAPAAPQQQQQQVPAPDLTLHAFLQNWRERRRARASAANPQPVPSPTRPAPQRRLSTHHIPLIYGHVSFERTSDRLAREMPMRAPVLRPAEEVARAAFPDIRRRASGEEEGGRLPPPPPPPSAHHSVPRAPRGLIFPEVREVVGWGREEWQRDNGGHLFQGGEDTDQEDGGVPLPVASVVANVERQMRADERWRERRAVQEEESAVEVPEPSWVDLFSRNGLEDDRWMNRRWDV